MDRELLIEIGLEELPAGWLPALNRQLAERVTARMTELRLPPGAPIETFSTPRRLTVRIARIAERQEDRDEVITGPPVSASKAPDGQPSPAAQGFARKQGVPFEQLTRVQTPKGEYLAYHRHLRGKSAVDTLPELLTGILRDLAFPKQMHWDATLDDGRGELLFGRPIRWLLFLYGGRVVPFTIGRAANAAGASVQDVESGALTYGHRFLATSGRAGRSIKVRSFDEYQARLAEHFVVLAHAERRDRIARDLGSPCAAAGRPRAAQGSSRTGRGGRGSGRVPRCRRRLLSGGLPRAARRRCSRPRWSTISTTSRWSTITARLKEAFLAVVNTRPGDERVIAKNAERVVVARLRDAKFFWDADRQVPAGVAAGPPAHVDLPQEARELPRQGRAD